MRGIGVFLPLHRAARPEQSFSDLAYDMVKLAVGCGILDIAYLLARPAIHCYLQQNGYDALSASLVADAVCIPAYTIAAMPIANAMGVAQKST